MQQRDTKKTNYWNLTSHDVQPTEVWNYKRNKPETKVKLVKCLIVVFPVIL